MHGEESPTEVTQQLGDRTRAEPSTGGDFAGFRILKPLGSGGMGQVFLAEQSVPVLRRVALKLIRAAVLTPELELRFRIEQQALAKLEHPCIARLYEAGATPGGFPWFAMELVEGLPLTEYADSRRLGIEARLMLYTQICEGVRHAHRRGILHRDLKPSNILVTEVDGRAHPKIIDFGIAKALDAPTGGRTLTGAELLGTPAYLAPEALDAAAGGDLDTRVDVYALGVILYELLAGARPHLLTGQSLLQSIRLVAETDAPSPAERWRTLDAEARARIAELRACSEAALLRLLAGELGWIASHAVARRREERYGSVEALQGDLERHARLEPLSIAPPSAWYRVKKLLQRRRGPALAIAAVFASLLGGIVAFSLAAARADREAAAARTARVQAERVSAFLVELFEQADPTRSRGETLTARAVLDQGAARIGEGLREEPAVRLMLLLTLARVYESLGLYAQALPLTEQALALAQAPSERVRALLGRGRLHFFQGEYAQSSARLGEALTLVDSGVELPVGELRELLNRFGTAERLQRHLSAADALHMRELTVAITTTGPSDPFAGPAYYALGFLASARSDFASAELLLLRCIAIYTARYGADDHRLAGPLRSLADVYSEQGRDVAAEPYYLRALAISERIYGPQHPHVALQLNNLGVSYYHQERLDEALAIFQRALAINQQRLPADHPELGNQYLNLGLVHLKRGEYADAETRFRQTMTQWEGHFPQSDPNWAWAWWGLGRVLLESGRAAQAEPWLRRALELRASVYPAGQRELVAARESLDEALRALGRTP
ncbi:MAG: serine/threonine protein kinase [Xanthomonadales bacterium]|nr:Serine/threonine-protein kinase PknD [Xanthomonadales bacterium]MCC6593538.1 serine/threonine protein kinase [Xanthomonadales bacterium]MCE7930986.1 tetratricopeptide repeat protein [Xanthomonadales bacterium PRO6]